MVYLSFTMFYIRFIFCICISVLFPLLGRCFGTKLMQKKELKPIQNGFFYFLAAKQTILTLFCAHLQLPSLICCLIPQMYCILCIFGNYFAIFYRKNRIFAKFAKISKYFSSKKLTKNVWRRVCEHNPGIQTVVIFLSVFMQNWALMKYFRFLMKYFRFFTPFEAFFAYFQPIFENVCFYWE